MIPMKSLDRYEREMLAAYEKGALVSVRPTRAQLAACQRAAQVRVRAPARKEVTSNHRLSGERPQAGGALAGTLIWLNAVNPLTLAGALRT